MYKNVFIRTFGCQMNELDSDIMLGALTQMGFTLADSAKDADIIVLNTCSVRERASEKIFGHIGELKRLKYRKPSLILVVAGCLAQEKKEKIIKLYPHVDLVVGTMNKKDFPDLINKIISEKKKITKVSSEQNEIYEPNYIERESKIKASVSIMEGCNNFCSYCIVPYVRGRELSRKKENIIAEITKLAQNGYKEIMLLGQNVNSYIDGTCDFADLIELVNNIEGVERIRFMTSHPKDISNKLIEKTATLKKVCEHFHFPLQSGSDKILNKMNRSYTYAEYKSKVDYIHKIIPNISITTDFIVGFSDEDANDFEKSVQAIKDIQFDGSYIFHYSPREGTIAYDFADNVSYEEKIQRLEKLLQVQEDIMEKNNKLLIGKTFEVLVEGESKKDKEQLTGRTRTNKIVIFNKNKEILPGQLVNIKINTTNAYTLNGEINKGD